MDESISNTQIMRYLYLKKIQKGGNVEVIVHGNSMFPVIKDGSTVIIKKEESYKVNDIIAFLAPDNSARIIVHRIISDKEQYYLTKGDNNDFIDPFRVYKKIILGRVKIDENNEKQ